MILEQNPKRWADIKLAISSLHARLSYCAYVRNGKGWNIVLQRGSKKCFACEQGVDYGEPVYYCYKNNLLFCYNCDHELANRARKDITGSKECVYNSIHWCRKFNLLKRDDSLQHEHYFGILTPNVVEVVTQ